MQRIQHYIAGDFIAGQSNECLPGINPATGETIYQLACADRALIDQAVLAAEQAFPSWSGLPAQKRADYLNALADCIADQFDEFAELECADTGKPLALVKQVDIPRSIDNLRFFAASATQYASESHASAQMLNYTLRMPLGVVACISPWNLPLYLFTWKIAPALAMGNCVVAKPSELTPLTANKLAECCQQIGLPAGVLNILHGPGASVGEPLSLHPKVRAVSFTGGSKTGGLLASKLAPQFKKYSLELGGKNAALIFADCDFDRMLDDVVRSSFSNQGQICLCTSRLLIAESIYEKFKAAFLARVQALKVGDPLCDSNQQGAVISLQHQQKILDYIALARSEGGSVLTGGDKIEGVARVAGGCFVAPTVIEGLSQSARCNQEEIFGPVVTLQKFADDKMAIALANDVNFGLCASVWTESVTRAHSVAQQLTVGMVWINGWLRRDLRTPFGGVKGSGVGREGGQEALRFFTEPKNVCLSVVGYDIARSK